MKAVRSKTFIGIERHTIEDYSPNDRINILLTRRLRQILYEADSLSVLDIDKITALSSVIHQNVYMFDESIFDNICLHEDFSKEELQSVLSDSGLSQFVEQVPNGLKYHVGENGDNLCY